MKNTLGTYPIPPPNKLSDSKHYAHVIASRDNELIFSMRENGELVILSDNQEVINFLSKEDAKNLALWILSKP
jgi:hypothetical protein